MTAQPAQWNYSIASSGNSIAAYSGDVVVGGSLSTVGFVNAKGDGSTDDTSQILSVLNSIGINGAIIDGGGHTFAVSENIVLPDVPLYLKNCKFIDLNTSRANCRTLFKSSGSNLILQNVKVDRGNQQTVGSIANDAGVYISNTKNVLLLDVEVTGGGKCNGVVLANNTGRVAVVRPYIHDMRFTAAVDPGTEQLVAFRSTQTDNLNLVDFHIENIDSTIAGVTRAYQTDGVDLDGTGWRMINGLIRNVGEGVDLAGSLGSFNFITQGLVLENCDSHGYKTGNLCQNGSVMGVTASDCGLVAFVVQGSNTVPTNITKTIRYTNCKAINTGSNGNWSGSNVCGFAIEQGGGAGAGSYTDDIVFTDCEAIDNQAVSTMKFGFRNEQTPNASQFGMNKLLNCKTLVSNAGAFVSKTLGFIGEFETTVRDNVGFSIPNNVVTAIQFDTVILDTYVQFDTVGKTKITVKEDGVYDIEVQSEITANATGFRNLNWSLNGGAQPERRLAAGTATVASSLGFSVRKRLNKNDFIEATMFQNSGGPLALVAGTSLLRVTRVHSAL